ncbi:glycosyl hydrolase [Anditalea andensis]|uniref:Glycosyl hydrolase n=1 Tax=Anditalea andensis TaxID=1048983 RepID=A0A074LEW2_9BACT|nr:glycosyl hydrolase [Anditalea andensis]
MNKILASALIITIVSTACNEGKGTADQAAAEPTFQDNTLTDAQKAEGWKLLFDGQNLDGWRGYNQENLPESWVVEEGTLKSLGEGGDIGGDIVYDLQEFGNFELSLDWKIEEGGNSGIFYHIVEGDQYETAYHTAPEFQLIDQEGFPEKLEPWQSLGGDYGMYDPDYEEAMKPAGLWNNARIIFSENKVEYYLNGKKTVEFQPWSEDWRQRKEEGKWKDFPDYGEARSGLIGLQDHGSFIWFKNIKIREL